MGIHAHRASGALVVHIALGSTASTGGGIGKVLGVADELGRGIFNRHAAEALEVVHTGQSGIADTIAAGLVRLRTVKDKKRGKERSF